MMAYKEIQHIVLFISIVSSFLTALLGSAINITLPQIGNELSIDTVLLIWINTSYLLSTTIFLVPLGRLSDRFQPGVIASIGMFITTVGLFLLRYIDICFIILGFGFALFSSPNTNAIISSVNKKLYGTASSIVSTMRMLGQTFSMGISTIVFTSVIGRSQIQSEDRLMLVNSIRLILTIFTSLSRGKMIRN
ncbi:MAG: MFS transporter [bacterium]